VPKLVRKRKLIPLYFIILLPRGKEKKKKKNEAEGSALFLISTGSIIEEGRRGSKDNLGQLGPRQLLVNLFDKREGKKAEKAGRYGGGKKRRKTITRKSPLNL